MVMEESASSPTSPASPPWPASLSFPLLSSSSFGAASASSGSSDNSSIAPSTSSNEADASGRGVADAESAARYFNNLRVASSDDDEPPGTPPNAIFRSRWPQPQPQPPAAVPKRGTNTDPQHQNVHRSRSASSPSSLPPIIRRSNTNVSSTSTSRLFIPFRPSRDYDDDIGASGASSRNNNPISGGGDLTRTPFDPYGEPVHRDCIPPFPILLNDDDDVEDPPLELSLSLADPPRSSYSPPRPPRRAASMLHTPPPAPVRRCHTYDEVHPKMHAAHLPKPTQTSTQGVLAVQGAELGNGIYKRTGRFDSAALYSMKATHNGHQVLFTIFRCVASDCTRKWHLSTVTPNSAKTSTCDALAPFAKHDIDLYTAPSIVGSGADELPPEDGWKAVSGPAGLGNFRTPHCLWVPMHQKEAATSPKRTAKKSSTAQGMETTTRKVTQCCVCMDERVKTVFVPCGHAATCEDCSRQWKSKLGNGSRRRCPIGRCKVKGVIKLYATVVEDED